MTESLVGVATGDLEALATALRRGSLARPWSASIAQLGLVRAASACSVLDHVDAPGLLAVINAVIAERGCRNDPAEIVWTGPEPREAASRDTAAVVEGMFRDARREVLVSSFSLDPMSVDRPPLFAQLHEVMKLHGVVAHVFYDIERCAAAAHKTLAEATAATTFLGLYWPFGNPHPALYYDPRALDPAARASMHAKMVVVDRRWVLIGSANLTDRGATRNIELGVKVDDPGLGERLAAHWLGAVAAGRLLEAHA